MTLAPSERDYFILFITLDGPGPEQINRPHKKQTLLPLTTLRDACTPAPAIDTDKHSIVSSLRGLWSPVPWIETDGICSFVSRRKHDISYQWSEFNGSVRSDAPGPPVRLNSAASQRTHAGKLQDLLHKTWDEKAQFLRHACWNPACVRGSSPLQPRALACHWGHRRGEITNLISCMFPRRWRSSPRSTWRAGSELTKQEHVYHCLASVRPFQTSSGLEEHHMDTEHVVLSYLGNT